MKSLSTTLFIVLLFFPSSLTLCFGEKTEKCFEINKKLGRGINLGNTFDAPTEGAWGVTVEAEDFINIKQAGFSSVRIPIRWSAHADEQPPYTINAQFFKRIDWAINNAKANDLAVIVNVHHYREICKDPNSHSSRLPGIWKQIAERYKNQPDSIVFELLNEPNKNLTPEKWNCILADTLDQIRLSNPDRIVMIGPGNWNNIGKLEKLKLPENDRNIIVTCHYYKPFEFTHQGATWVGKDADQWLGTKWNGDKNEKLEILKDFKKAAMWGQKNNRPINIGEFGAYSKADFDSRVKWTGFIATSAQRFGFSCHYWEYYSGFGVFDPKEKKWRKPLLDALIPKEPSE